ncbi:hypothetical protein [Sorangium sp. So ce394]|uniref:hypothetical protein n=1 Tax=Sorangium sp. So ce394 TaxID=3133310 RepID=UPI003F5BA8B2
MLDFLPAPPHLTAARELSAAYGRMAGLSSSEDSGQRDVSAIELGERRDFMPRFAARKWSKPEHLESMGRPFRRPRPVACRKPRCLTEEQPATAASAR